jgi:cobalt/nickel transport protein
VASFALTLKPKEDTLITNALRTVAIIMAAMLLFPLAASAHFAMVIPSTDVVAGDGKKDIDILVQFTHPFEGGPQMQMDRPLKFGVVVDDKAKDLLKSLTEKKVHGKSVWETSFKIKKPGDYIFYVLPQPYWEPAEDKFIIHATKVIVDALGAEEGWESPIAAKAGLPCEIVPLTRPYSLYAGNLFTGQVFMKGKPVANADVEIEWWGKGTTKAPTDTHITQVVRTDEQGRFSYAMPKSGWWGFAALMDSPEKIKHDGKDKDVEVGAVLWVYAHPMQ